MYKHMHNQKPQVNIQQNQQGLAAIMVTIILMLVLTLIVLSFAKISRREQRNALDRQLSTQAFYAAESGINDARAAVKTWATSANPVEQAKLKSDYMSDCTTFASPPIANLPLGIPLAGSGAASYTCVFVDPSPTSLEFTKSNKPQIFPIEDKNGVAITSLEIEWDDGSGGNDFSGCPPLNNNPQSLPPGSGCDAPVLRVELVDGSTPGGLTSSKVYFLYPSPSGAGTLSYASPTGTTALGNCTVGTSKKCEVTLGGLSATKYYVRIKSIYKPAAMTISANGGNVQFIGAQAILDATGKATDVERRIQVRIKTNTLATNVPLYGLEGNDQICKKYSLVISNSDATDEGNCWGGIDPN
jgi:hypothetical protein